MFTAPARHLAGLVVLGVVGLIVYLFGDVVFGDVGDVREGWDAVWEAVFVWKTGDLFGFMLLLVLAVAATAALGVVLASNDTDRLPDPADEVPVSAGSYWPLGTAVGLGVAAVGVVVNTQLAILGLVIVGFAGLEWAVTSWTDRHSDDPAANRSLRDRFMVPIEIPVFALALVALPVVMLSRILLTVSAIGAAVVASVVAIVILAIAFAVYARPTLPRNAVAGAVVLLGVALIGGGVVSAAVGEREFESHVGDHGGEGADEGAGTDEEERTGGGPADEIEGDTAEDRGTPDDEEGDDEEGLGPLVDPGQHEEPDA